MVTKKELQIGGSTLSIETGKLAKQASGSVVVRLGDTVVLATACFKDSAGPGDFMPLTVDYKEYTYAGGRIPGGFFKREGRPTEKETLTARLIDRPLRPSFAPGYRQETQVIGLVLSADGQNDPDVLALNGASAALVLSEIPFPNPIGAVRVGRVDGKFVINPTNSDRDLSDLDLIVAGTEHAIVMVEAGARELDESVILDALDEAHRAIKEIVNLQKELRAEAGKEKIEVTVTPKYSDELYKDLSDRLYSDFKGALLVEGKQARRDKVREVKEKALEGIDAENLEEISARKAAMEGSPDADHTRPHHQRTEAPRWPPSGRDPRHLDRDQRASAYARFCNLHPRRDAGARHDHSRNSSGSAEGRGLRGRDVPEIPPALQLPAILGRRGEVHARTSTSRDRPR